MIAQLCRRAFDTAVAKGWYDPPKSNVESLALVHSEVSEAVECLRTGEPPLYFKEDGKPEGVVAELADVVIRVADLCESNMWDLQKAIEVKMEYNKTRTVRHGNKLY